MIKSGLIKAKIMHKRFLPKVNQFVYNVFYICKEISEIYKIKSPFFSINKFNFFSFYNRDYGKKNSENPEIWLQEILFENNIKIDGKIFLITHPRILGYVFNPINFWLCFDKNQQLIAVLCEVNNTFKESHSYLIFDKENGKIDNKKFYQSYKEFHVSPFMKREGFYKFRFDLNQEKILITIDYFNQENQKMLITSLSGKITKFNNLALIKNFIFIPFLTFKVIFLIHYQALKLILKKIKYVKKPKQLQHKLTINND